MKSNGQPSVDFGKADGSYAMLASQLRAEFTPFENFRFEVGAIANYAAISGVSGLDDRNEVQFGGFALEGQISPARPPDRACRADHQRGAALDAHRRRKRRAGRQLRQRIRGRN